jgi:hypothetical protein
MNHNIIFILLFATSMISSQLLMADVKSNLEVDIKNHHQGDNIATAESYGSGNENIMSVKAGSVNINLDSKCCTDGMAKYDMKLKVMDRHKGKNLATIKKGSSGNMNQIEAAAGTVNITVGNGVR